MIKRPLGKEGTIIPNFYAPSDTVSKHEKLIELKGELDNQQIKNSFHTLLLIPLVMGDVKNRSSNFFLIF